MAVDLNDLYIQSMVGSRTYYTNFKKSLTSGASFKELVGLETLSGGDIKNDYDTYRPFNSDKVYKCQTTQDYGDLVIRTAKMLGINPTVFEDSAAREIFDLCKKRTKIDLIKCVPIGSSGRYECTIYSGFFGQSNLDNVSQSETSKGSYTFVVTDVNEAVGTINSSGVLSLTARS